MASAARRNLRRLAFLCRALAALVGAVLGAQVYARGGRALIGLAAGLATWAALELLLGILIRRHRRMLEEVEREAAEAPRPAPARKRRRTRRVLTDPDE